MNNCLIVCLFEQPNYLVWFVIDIEMKITAIACEMEQEGAYFDKELATLYREKYSRLAEESQEKINEFFAPVRGQTYVPEVDENGNIIGPLKKPVKIEWPLNVVSSDQVLAALWKMGIKPENSQAGTLEALAKIYPIMQVILDYRSDNHMVTSFFDPLIEKVNPVTGRIHASFSNDLRQRK